MTDDLIARLRAARVAVGMNAHIPQLHANGDMIRVYEVIDEAIAALTADAPVFWQHAIDECNAAHAALDRLGAPTIRAVTKRDGTGRQEITIGLADRIAAIPRP